MANIDTMRRQLRTMGADVRLGAEVITCDPEYYRWNQWFFLQFLERGLAYRAVSPVDWCPNDGTLAREQVEGADRHCERCGTQGREARPGAVVLPDHRLRRRAAELRRHRLAGADPDDADATGSAASRAPRSRSRRRHRPHHAGGEELRVFTTRPDTIFGVTFMVLAPEHPLVETLTTPDQRGRGRGLRRPGAAPDRDRPPVGRREKTGVFIGAYAINPFNGERIPIYVADYVLASYGTGAVMGVPAHDERDFEFARQYGLPIVERRAARGRGPGHRARRRRTSSTRRRGAWSTPARSTARPADDRHGTRSWSWRRGAGQGPSGRHLPPARLAGQPPALLGHADPDHLLRDRRRRARPRRRAAGAAARHVDFRPRASPR